MSNVQDKMRGNWNMIKGSLKQKYGELTNNDLAYEEGQEDLLLGRIQHKIGKTKEEVIDFIDSL